MEVLICERLFLRDFDPLQMQFTIYTDLRSKKVEELTDHPQAQFLFYDATRLIQLVVDAHLVECTQDTPHISKFTQT